MILIFQAMECEKLENLRRNHLLLCDNIDLENTSILDELYQSDLLTSDDIDDIKSNQGKREQTRTLLNILTRSDPKLKPYESFINAISAEYGFIVSQLQQTLKTKNGSHDTCKSCTVCPHCDFLNNLDPRRVLDVLYQDRIISSDEIEHIYRRQLTRKHQVKKLLEVLSSKENPRKSFKVLLDNLPNKYQYLKRKVKNFEQLSKSCCKRKKGKIVEDDVTRRDCGFTFQESAPYARGIVQVKKCSPYSKAEVKELGKIWNKLWHYREQGSWEELDQMTKDYFEKYSDSPDVLALLYRSEMGTWAFYRYDYDKACKCFEDAMDILPFTKMNSWHLGRILATQIAICVKQGRYTDADSALVKARQSTALLPPCLATGTVNVFEGLYFSSLSLHCDNDKTYKDYKDRARLCFLSAIRDYQGVNFFAIKSFLSEIYIFLAMLELGIDFKQIDGHFQEGRHVQLSENTISSEIERYLCHFKEECWGLATNWSKMLYHIVRAEQQKILHQYEAAKESFNDAAAFGMVGKFKNQLSYISYNMDMLEEKMQAKKVIRLHSEDNMGVMNDHCLDKRMYLPRDFEEGDQ